MLAPPRVFDGFLGKDIRQMVLVVSGNEFGGWKHSKKPGSGFSLEGALLLVFVETSWFKVGTTSTQLYKPNEFEWLNSAGATFWGDTGNSIEGFSRLNARG
jgi:hypothetical protein